MGGTARSADEPLLADAGAKRPLMSPELPGRPSPNVDRGRRGVYAEAASGELEEYAEEVDRRGRAEIIVG